MMKETNLKAYKEEISKEREKDREKEIEERYQKIMKESEDSGMSGWVQEQYGHPYGNYDEIKDQLEEYQEHSISYSSVVMIVAGILLMIGLAIGFFVKH